MNDFIEISKYAGMRCDLVQAGGGNTSVKLDERTMIIKSSGIQMADVNEKDGYSTVDNYKLLIYMNQLISQDNFTSPQNVINEFLISGKKPSIETFLHAVTDRLTLHTHPVVVNILAARKGGMKELEMLFPDALFIDYATPGIDLAKKYYLAFLESKKNNKEPNAVFLKNHGLVISGKSASEVIEKTENILAKIESYLGIDLSIYRYAYKLYSDLCDTDFLENKIIVKVENKIVIDSFIALEGKMWNYQFCPDCLVYCGKRVLEYSENMTKEELQSFVSSNGEPIIIIYEKNIFIRADSVKKAREIEDVLAFSAQIVLYNKNCSLDMLSETEQNFLLNWDEEKYRQKLKM